MILKFWGNLYNISNDWKKIYLDDDYLYISFPYVINGEDVEGVHYSEPYELTIDLDPNEDSHDIAREHKDWDHKDARQLMYRITSKAYDKVIEKLLDKTEYYDLDADYSQILKDAEAELVKEYEEYDEE